MFLFYHHPALLFNLFIAFFQPTSYVSLINITAIKVFVLGKRLFFLLTLFDSRCLHWTHKATFLTVIFLILDRNSLGGLEFILLQLMGYCFVPR